MKRRSARAQCRGGRMSGYVDRSDCTGPDQTHGSGTRRMNLRLMRQRRTKRAVGTNFAEGVAIADLHGLMTLIWRGG